MQLTATIVRMGRLGAADAGAMLALHRQYYDHVMRETFEADLREKDWVIVLREPGGSLAGFSTLQLIPAEVNGVLHQFLFSGDTVVEERHRTSPRLAGAFGHVLVRLMREHGESNLHWFLISKGFRTYRFLPVFFPAFFPTFNRATPPCRQRLLDAIAAQRFGGRYDPATGVIRMRGEGDWLKPVANEIPEGRLRDPHVAFFLRRNPGHVRGDELACLAEISARNLNRFAWRVIKATPVTWDE